MEKDGGHQTAALEGLVDKNVSESLSAGKEYHPFVFVGFLNEHDGQACNRFHNHLRVDPQSETFLSVQSDNFV